MENIEKAEMLNNEKETVAVEETTGASLYNLNYILQQIARITEQTAHVTDAIAALGGMEDSEWSDAGARKAKAESIAKVIQCRETTNQRVIALYESMYMNLTHQAAVERYYKPWVDKIDAIDDDETKANLLAHIADNMVELAVTIKLS